jgi:hypothetical protein
MSGLIYGGTAGAGLANTATQSSSGNAIWNWNGYGTSYGRNSTLGEYDTIDTNNVNVGWE